MELDISLTQQIDEIQRRLRECNFECNRLKDLVVQSIPDLLRSKDKADAEVLAKTAQITALQTQLAELRKRQSVVSKDAPISAPESLVSEHLPPQPETVLPETVAPVIEPAPVVPVVTVTHTPVQALPPVAPSTAPAAVATAPRPKAQPAASKSKEGLEDFIGGNLLNKIGIGILIIGIGIFVKYAIDKDWIGPVGRVMVGLLSGGILLGVAHWLRTAYKAFSSVLLGGGIAVLYFSVAIAYHQYGLLGQPAAFALMCGVTAAAVFFSIAYDRQEIAVLALLGSFATPFMVSKGEGNWVVLFSYILIVNLGMLVLAWFREWKLVRILGYSLTLLLFGGWVLREYATHGGIVPGGALVFGTLFFLTFFMTTLAYRVRKQQVADTFTYISLISNTVFYYACSMLVIQQLGGGVYMGIFTAAMAVFHFSFILPLRRLLKVSDHVQTMLIGMVLTFVTLAIPIQLKGDYITLFWAFESLLLLYMAQRTRLNILQVGSVLVSGLAVVILGYHWATHYGSRDGLDQTFLLDGAYLTSFLTAAAMVGLYWLHRRNTGQNDLSESLSKGYQILSLPLFYFGFLFELMDWLRHDEGSMLVGAFAFTSLFLSGMLVWALMSRQKTFGNVVIVLGLITLVAWAVAQVAFLGEMRHAYLSGYAGSGGFPWHFLAFAGMLLLLGLGFQHARKQVDLQGDMGKLLIWGFSIMTLIVLSTELDHVLGLMGFSANISHKVGYPILWGISGFTMIALGMREKLLSLRIGGLALFLLILLKLFLFDIREVSPGGKIAAFISLGVLLLVISFMYQRLRKLLSAQDDAMPEGES
ncbi:MAG TPA: DUF2339 domain-containing protein [Bacteroidia bacterium]|nr:DUF2339 domain-containing protein [Bacteroidia bacterium]